LDDHGAMSESARRDHPIAADARGKIDVNGNELYWLRSGEGAHGDVPLAPDVVARSLDGAFRFAEETKTEEGLRAPQLGAVHAILAYRSMEAAEPVTVVMPTGTGKTETMLAVFCHSPERTLVVVPSDALRAQIADKFATLGVLPKVNAIVGDFRCPIVLLLKSGLTTAEQVDDLLGRANVVVATAQVLTTCTEAARARLTELCDRLFVDEAHHVAAKTWRVVTEMFQGKEIVQFTATPYREDGRHLGGTIAYAYPLRLAQKNGFFARINYRSIVDPVDPDRAVAVAAVAQLRDDIAAGRDHLLMARVSSVARARDVIGLYEELAPEFQPIRIDTGLAESSRTKGRDALLVRDSRIVVCVNMLGEGFDLPALKVAAIHDPQKSLAVTLQFIGRFTRQGGDDLGEASAFVPLQFEGVDDRLRRLYGEDADWNEVIQDLTEHAVGDQKARSEFETAFTSLPREVAIRSIHPKMSTVVYRSTGDLLWEPDRIYDLFEGRLLTTRLGINGKDKVVWWVSEEAMPVRWGDIASFNELVHHLHVVHVDDTGGFLYINSTNNDSLHEDIAKAIGGDEVGLVRGDVVYRVLARVSRRVPTNVGLLDAVSRTRRFSLHVGQDVLAAWSGEGGTKMKTNIFAHGFANGRAVSFGASRKGRVWSHEEARDIHDWVQWARRVGPAIADESISLNSVMSGFLLPEEAKERPPYVPLAVEWPYELMATISASRTLSHVGQAYTFLDAELQLIDHTATGPLAFEVVTPGWRLGYEYVFQADELPVIRPLGDDGQVTTPKGAESLSAFLTRNGLQVTFEDDLILVARGYLLRPDRARHLFPSEALQPIEWAGIDITKESQGSGRDPSTVQYRAIEVLASEEDWEVVIDDDSTGELADVALMRRRDDDLEVLLVHCKFSSKPEPGARIEDLYDVCGQAMKMNRAKSIPDQLARRLLRREQDRQAKGRTGIIRGDVSLLGKIVQEARHRRLDVTVAIVQPGASKALMSDDMRALLGATERFLMETYGMKLRVLCSS
jgi:superfamily II DNA or RNA helicase